MKWGAKSSADDTVGGPATATGPLAIEDAEYLDSAGNGGREAFNILDDDALVRVNNPSLPAPFAAASTAITEKVKGIKKITFTLFHFSSVFIFEPHSIF